jgi:hypothetical protein
MRGTVRTLLHPGLEFAGFAPFLDRRDIAAGEDWESVD